MFTVTPLHLEIVMHYHTRGRDMENLNAPAVVEYARDLMHAGMVERIVNEAGAECTYRTTERGVAWLEHLLTVPFPTQKWVIERP